MCRTCWIEDWGSPKENSPEIRRAVELIHSIYETEDSGCPLHTALDDWNVDQPWEPWGDRDDLEDPRKWDVALELSDIMNSLPISARASALARASGYIEE